MEHSCQTPESSKIKWSISAHNRKNTVGDIKNADKPHRGLSDSVDRNTDSRKRLHHFHGTELMRISGFYSTIGSENVIEVPLHNHTLIGHLLCY